MTDDKCVAALWTILETERGTRAFEAAMKRGREVYDEYRAAPSARAATHLDTERMEWLRRMHVEVRIPAVHGSFHLFHSSPTDTDGDEEPSNIREQIDYQRKGGDKP